MIAEQYQQSNNQSNIAEDGKEDMDESLPYNLRSGFLPQSRIFGNLDMLRQEAAGEIRFNNIFQRGR